MNFLPVLLFVPLWFFLPGYLLCRTLFRNPGAFSTGERWFFPIALSVCVTTWIALTLAEFGIFSPVNVSLLVALLSGGLLLSFRGRFAAWSLLDFKPDWVLIAVGILAVLLFARPAEYVIGNSDAGTYINTGANIARTGGIAIYDAQVAQLPPDPAKTFYWQLINPFMLYTQVRLPGFFIADQTQGLVLPQFLQFYPVWLALWDSMLGVQLGLYATPIIALSGSLAFYFLAKKLFESKFARLAWFLLVVTVPQFWFARYPVAEAMTQFLMLTAMLALLKMGTEPADDTAKNNRFGLGLVAGMAFGQVFFTRADAILLLLPIALYALVLIFLRRWRREHWAMFGAFAIVLGQAVAHMLVFAPNYLYYQYSHALRMQNIDKLLRIQLPDAQALFSRVEYALILLGAGIAGLVVLIAADRAVQWARARWGGSAVARFGGFGKYARAGGALLVLLLFVLLYLVLPRPGSLYAYVGGLTPTGGEANLIKLGWYLSPIAVCLAAVGAILVLLRDLNARNAFLYGTAALFSLVYLDELYSNPHYIYTTRHYIPLVIPLFILLAVRALKWMWEEMFPAPGSRQRAARLSAAGLLVMWLVYNTYAMGLFDVSRANGFVLRLPFVLQMVAFGGVRLEPFENSVVGVRELDGAYAQVEGLAQRLAPDGVIIFSAGRDEPAAIATPLRLVFGRDAFVTVFNNPPGEKIAGMIDAWRAQGREVILAYGTNGGKLQVPGYALEPAGEFAFDVPQWAFAYDFMPRSAWRVNLNYALYRAVPRTAPAVYPFVLNFGGSDFPFLANGFLERPPEAQTRWIGAVADDAKTREAKWVSGVVRIPVAEGTSDLELTLAARAPRDGVRLQVKSGEYVLGNAALTADWAKYTFQIPRAELRTVGEMYVIEFVSQTTLQDGRMLGAELESLRLANKE